MKTMTYGKKGYLVDEGGFLLDREQWDEDFAEGMAPMLKIPRLTQEHWRVIHFIRNMCRRDGRCPLVYEACRENDLRLKDLKRLFPTGYQRGACKLAGITYRDAYPEFMLVPSGQKVEAAAAEPAKARADSVAEKTYEVDVHGFLIDSEAWDERYAFLKSLEMGYPKGLTEQHWKIIYFLRDSFRLHGAVPTVYDVCEVNNLELEDLEKLFPHGFHRGAVKLAGLRIT
jgi:tRNA 2-thiouridine synthesizing protein E